MVKATILQQLNLKALGLLKMTGMVLIRRIDKNRPEER